MQLRYQAASRVAIVDGTINPFYQCCFAEIQLEQGGLYLEYEIFSGFSFKYDSNSGK